jgi:hypothetical protein
VNWYRCRYTGTHWCRTSHDQNEKKKNDKKNQRPTSAVLPSKPTIPLASGVSISSDAIVSQVRCRVYQFVVGTVSISIGGCSAVWLVTNLWQIDRSDSLLALWTLARYFCSQRHWNSVNVGRHDFCGLDESHCCASWGLSSIHGVRIDWKQTSIDDRTNYYFPHLSHFQPLPTSRLRLRRKSAASDGSTSSRTSSNSCCSCSAQIVLERKGSSIAWRMHTCRRVGLMYRRDIYVVQDQQWMQISNLGVHKCSVYLNEW